MQAESTIEPTVRRRTMLARLWSVIGGDSAASGPKER
jgi:hypothetical protein